MHFISLCNCVGYMRKQVANGASNFQWQQGVTKSDSPSFLPAHAVQQKQEC